jgi:hypothetical protein
MISLLVVLECYGRITYMECRKPHDVELNKSYYNLVFLGLRIRESKLNAFFFLNFRQKVLKISYNYWRGYSSKSKVFMSSCIYMVTNNH